MQQNGILIYLLGFSKEHRAKLQNTATKPNTARSPQFTFKRAKNKETKMSREKVQKIFSTYRFTNTAAVESDACHFCSLLTPLQCSTLSKCKTMGTGQSSTMAGHESQPNLMVECRVPFPWHEELHSMKTPVRLIYLKGMQRI